MTGVEADMLQARLDRFLQGTAIYMERKGFMMAPLGSIPLAGLPPQGQGWARHQ